LPDQFPLKLLLDRVFPAQVNRYDENWSKQWFGAGIFAEGSEEVPVDVFRKLERRKVLSTVERAGLLSRAEQLGVTLSSLERLGLLSKAEDLGMLSLVEAAAGASPSALASISLPLLVAAVAAVVVKVRAIPHFFTTTNAGLGLYIFLIILPFIGEPGLSLLPVPFEIFPHPPIFGLFFDEFFSNRLGVEIGFP